VGAVAWATLDLIFSEERQVARRLKDLSDNERREAGEVEPLSIPFYHRVLQPAGTSMVSLFHRLAPIGYRKRLDARCRMAGRPLESDGDSMLAMKVLLAGILAVVGSVAAAAAWDSAARTAAVFLMSVVLGWFIPDIWISGRISKRKDDIRRQLPDMLDMLTIAVEAGLGFDAAVTKYVRNQSGALAQEFSVALREIQAGMSRREAMRNLAERCDVIELSTFVTAMVQADVFGVSVGSVLRTQSREMRVKRRQRAEEIAQKAPAKMVFPLILCILPATLIVLMTPVVIGIMRAFGSM
jgi:tight adherence protein C